MLSLGFFRGFCDFCGIDDSNIEIKEYQQPSQEIQIIYLCDLCAQLSPNERREFPILEHINYGINHVVNQILKALSK